MSDALQSIGCSIIPDFINQAEEFDLIAIVEAELAEFGESDSGGRTQWIRYGWDYAGQKQNREIPAWLECFRDSFPVKSFNSVTINKYDPGAFIKPHVDSRAFGEPILILGIGGACIFKLSNESQQFAFNFYPRMLVSLSGPCRHPWKHGVEPVKELRYSVVFRTKK